MVRMNQMGEQFLTVAFEPFSSVGEQILDGTSNNNKNAFSIIQARNP